MKAVDLELAADLGDEVRCMCLSQAQASELLCSGLLRLGILLTELLTPRSFKNDKRRAIIDAYRKRAFQMLQVVQFADPLPFLITRTMRS